MTPIGVRDSDPGEGRAFVVPTAPGPARSVDVPARPASPIPDPPVAPDQASPTAQEWAHIVSHLREGVVVCDAQGLVRYLNPIAASLLPEVAPGGPLALPTGEGPGEFAHHGRRVRARSSRLVGGGRCWYIEECAWQASGGDPYDPERARSTFLAAAGEKLGNPLHPDRAAAATVRLAVPTLGEVAVLVGAARAGRVRWWRATREAGGTSIDSGVIPVPDLPPAIEEGLTGVEPHAVDWLAEQAAELGWLPTFTLPDVCARMVPLPGQGSPVGVLLVARRAVRPYTTADVELVRAFAARAGAALTSAVLHRDQAEVADTLQASLLPVEPSEVAGVQWGSAYRPARTGLRIGGDFYGAHRLPGGGSLFYLGDVSGKGVEAAVFTGQVRQCLQALHRVESQPTRLLRLLNGALLETTLAHGQGRFATMVLGMVHPHRDGGLTLTMAGGGHLPPLMLRSSGEVEPVALRGMLIGVVPDPRIGEVTARLAPGETCVLYSDGVTEARGGLHGTEQFGPDRLARTITACHRMPAPALAERIEQVTCDWLTHGDHDDIAVLALRASGPGGRGPRHLTVVPDLAAGPTAGWWESGPPEQGRRRT